MADILVQLAQMSRDSGDCRRGIRAREQMRMHHTGLEVPMKLQPGDFQLGR
jgi:hypothetical protein